MDNIIGMHIGDTFEKLIDKLFCLVSVDCSLLDDLKQIFLNILAD